MPQYKVRDGFFVHLGNSNVKEPGTIIELSELEAEKYAHQLELVVKPKKENSTNESKV